MRGSDRPRHRSRPGFCDAVAVHPARRTLRRGSHPVRSLPRLLAVALAALCIVLGTAGASVAGGGMPAALRREPLPHRRGGHGAPARRRPEHGSPKPPPRASAPLARLARCPWASPQALTRTSPAELAAEVASRLTLRDELGIVDLVGTKGYENINSAIPALCIPSLTLQDGPDGLTNHDTGVTQLPSSMDVAATFLPADAYANGAVVGAEAKAQGIDAVQGPMLNLLRVPEDGRAYETYGEDPVLAADLGVADIEGIQHQGVMADAKHFSLYNQESNRHRLDQVVTRRQLAELYDVPFAAAVTRAHVASIMCAYGFVNGVPDCSVPLLYESLRSWHFAGFVRSDMQSVRQPIPAFQAGLDAIKPAAARQLGAAVAAHRLAPSTLRAAAQRILTEMFSFGLVAHPLAGRTDTKVTTPAHAAVALRLAEDGITLLKNAVPRPPARSRRGARRAAGLVAVGAPPVLPLEPSRTRSVAVIGSDAALEAMSAGYGGARVIPPFVVAPVTALARAFRRGAVRYEPGGSGIGGTSPIPLEQFSADYGASGPGPGGVPRSLVPVPDRRGTYHLVGTLTPQASGLYDLALEDAYPTWFLLDGRPLFDTPAGHQVFTWSSAVPLLAHHGYRVEIVYRPGADSSPPRLTWRYVSPEIARAVAAARASQVAIVFASDYSSEGMDRPDLSLPGDENQLIAAVAAANPRTVVVLNTAGPVLMPWIGDVAAVVEAWYPGEEDGNAVTAALTGVVDPGGHLPVTFPASESAVPAHTLAEWPGINGTVDYSEGIDIGYRWDQANHVRPLFPFGYGLSYTTFSLTGFEARWSRSGVDASVVVTDTGHRAGSQTVQGYLGFPAAAAEPPWQLKVFDRVTLRAGRSARIVFRVPASAFSCFLAGRWRVVPGRYVLAVGTSSADLPLRTSAVIGR